MTGDIRNYRNEVWLSFDEKGDNFTMNLPHAWVWEEIIDFLQSRGWTIGPNPTYLTQYPCLSDYHRLGVKGNVSCLMEISCWQIRINFGHSKNLWTGLAQSFWNDPTDNRHTKLTYLESIAVKLEIFRTMQFCSKYGFRTRKEESEMTPEERIIDKLRVNKHIHGEVNCLDDIRKDIMERKSYDRDHNSTDRDGKFILSGTRKSFYDYTTRRIATGMAYHNINNMWWVVYGNQLRNIASWELFDYNQDPRRRPVTEKRINDLLDKFQKVRDYKKCMHIAQYADKMGLSIKKAS